MAHIIKSQSGGSADAACTLDRVSFDRQRDVFKLAQMGEKSSMRLWDDFARQCPDSAALVVADVNSDKAKAAAANKHLDLVLSKAEKPKKNKPKKARANSKNIAARNGLTALLRADLAHPDPSIREAARAALHA